jgi:hypothetical protein
MISVLEKQLQKELRAKEEAMRPYNKRIKNLKTAINNLKQYDETADEMNTKEVQIVQKTNEF